MATWKTRDSICHPDFFLLTMLCCFFCYFHWFVWWEYSGIYFNIFLWATVKILECDFWGCCFFKFDIHHIISNFVLFYWMDFVIIITIIHIHIILYIWSNAEHYISTYIQHTHLLRFFLQISIIEVENPNSENSFSFPFTQRMNGEKSFWIWWYLHFRLYTSFHTFFFGAPHSPFVGIVIHSIVEEKEKHEAENKKYLFPHVPFIFQIYSISLFFFTCSVRSHTHTYNT